MSNWRQFATFFAISLTIFLPACGGDSNSDQAHVENSRAQLKEIYQTDTAKQNVSVTYLDAVAAFTLADKTNSEKKFIELIGHRQCISEADLDAVQKAQSIFFENERMQQLYRDAVRGLSPIDVEEAATCEKN